MKKVLFVGSGGVSDYVRCNLPAEELTIRGLADSHLQVVNREGANVEFRGSEFDTVVICRPFNSKLVLAYKKEGVRVIVDMDDNFHAIPMTHPAYKSIGRGNPLFLQDLELSFSMADMITVTTAPMYDYMKKYNSNVVVIPNGWSARNLNWFIKHEHKSINIGWAGTITHRTDFTLALWGLKKVVDQYENVKIVIGGDPEIFRWFHDIPEKQKIFLPMVDYVLYPYTLSYSDIWLAPLEDTEFNKYKSDIKLVDAGVRQMAAIASPTSFYSEWWTSAMLPSYKDSWYSCMLELIHDPVLREHYGEEGWKHAQEREMGKLIDRWIEVL